MKTPEGKLKDKIKAYLTQMGAYFFMPVQMGMGATTVDILCCLKGRFLAIETKAEGKKPTPRQELTIRQVKAAGGVAFYCDSYASFLLNMATYDLTPERQTAVFELHTGLYAIESPEKRVRATREIKALVRAIATESTGC